MSLEERGFCIQLSWHGPPLVRRGMSTWIMDLSMSDDAMDGKRMQLVSRAPAAPTRSTGPATR
jgi:hypothetical protein